MLLGWAETAVKLDIAGLGDGNGYFPGLHGLGFEAFGESAGCDLDFDSIEAEFSIDAAQDVPAILGCCGGGEAFFEVLDGDVGVEETAKGSVDEEAAGDAELDVTEVLDCRSRWSGKRPG